MVIKEPVAELHAQFSSPDATLTPWAEARGRLEKAEVYCLDAEGAVWYGDVPAQRFLRVREGGEVLQMIELDRGRFACMLGGVDKRTLFMIAAEFSNAASMAGTRTGQVLAVEAPAPGAGWP